MEGFSGISKFSNSELRFDCRETIDISDNNSSNKKNQFTSFVSYIHGYDNSKLLLYYGVLST